MFNARYVVEAQARWIEEMIRPDIFAVPTLKKARRLDDGWEWGDRFIYDRAAATSLNNLSRTIFKNAYRRFGKQIPVATTIEGNRFDMRYHLNFLIRKPDFMSFEDFEQAFRSEWSKNDWALPDLTFEERTGDCVRYALKEGPDSLLMLSTRY